MTAAGIDTLIGGIGDDLYIVDVNGDTVTELTGGGTADEDRTTVSAYTTQWQDRLHCCHSGLV